MNRRNNHHRASNLALCLGALGVVYGDIVTSPLYALRECFHGPHAIEPSPENVLGVLSLIFWSLLIVISVKYLALIMQADNDGEGGILALMALVAPIHQPGNRRRHYVLILIGLFGAALLYGDGMITPAISVLSAVEGLELATPVFEPYVLPIAIVILVGLFLVQSRGSQRIGATFGPVMLVWFIVLAVTGLVQIATQPSVMDAINPLHGAEFFIDNGWHGFLILGIVFLVVTGGEALYADMGHFGRWPIRVAWFAVVLPGLLINYFGQGALILSDPSLVRNPFYNLVAPWMLYPLVVLATTATVVASQAVISGVFSLTLQAVQLGYLPRVEIRHTSESEFGQIYVPLANWLLLICTLGLVVGFGSSSRLASAYGVAVTTTMVITTLLAFFAMKNLWKWNVAAAAGLTALLLVIDLSFFGANIVKVLDRGWFPLLIGLAIVTVMTTWHRGRQLLANRLAVAATSYEELFEQLDADPPTRVPGTEIHLWSHPSRAPLTLLRNLRHNHVLHEQVAVVTVVFDKKPQVRSEDRVEFDEPRAGFFRIRIHYGFMQRPNVPRALGVEKLDALNRDPDTTTYILGRETVLATKRPGMAIWREKLFAFLARNAIHAANFFHIPTKQVLEIGAEVEI